MSSYGEFINHCEAIDGLRFSWNCWPTSRNDVTRDIVPLGCLYTPIKELINQPLHYSPVICSREDCKAAINPYCLNSVDFVNLLWTCNICWQRNYFPKQYAGMTIDNIPAELQLTTTEYIIKTTSNPLIFLIVLDTCLETEELKSVKAALQTSLSFLPKSSLVGFISFGKMVIVYELLKSGKPKTWAFPGTKDFSNHSIHDMVNADRSYLENKGGPGFTHLNGGSLAYHLPSNKFFRPLESCEMILMDIIEELQIDNWPVNQGRRPKRCVGSALNIAINLLEAVYPNTVARIMTFIGGPCTIGQGTIIDDDLKNVIRSHHDIENDNVPFMYKALKYYKLLASRAAQNGFVVDIYSCSLDQTGLHEMRFLPNYTGGHMILADSFESQLFQQTFRRVFLTIDNIFRMDFNAVIQVKTSPHLKVRGCIGPCFSNNVNGPNVSNNEIGIGKTNTWRVNGINPSTTLAFFLETAKEEKLCPRQYGNSAIIQYVTRYQHVSGQTRLRVTSVCRNLLDVSIQKHELVASFDQETAAVLMGRMVVLKTENQNPTEVLRWLDRQLIRLCQKFGEYNKDAPSSFRFPEEFAYYPQFIFHLRRSQFLQVFNNSPDELAYYKCMLCREISSNCLLMIQPSLTSYNLQMDSEPVLLDSSSIQKDTILLMDSFFHILIYYGENIKHWIQRGYHTMPEYAGLNNVISKPRQEAESLLRNRFPLPRFVLTEHGGSQARFLFCKVNPSSNYKSGGYEFNQENGSTLLSDDVSLQVFMEHLIKLTVSNSM